MRILRCHALVRRNEGREPAAVRHAQKFVVTQRAAVVKNGGLNRNARELLLKWPAEARRHTDVEENLHPRASGRGSAVWVAGCGGANGRRASTQDRSRSPAINLEVAQELVQGDAVLDPVEELLDRQTRAAETGHTAHARRINPNRVFKPHGTIRACFGKRLHRRARVHSNQRQAEYAWERRRSMNRAAHSPSAVASRSEAWRKSSMNS